MKLGINIDHIATLRNARRGLEPDVLQGMHIAIESGCDSIVCHLRVDRRHITDEDVYAIRKNVTLPMNLEASLEDEIIDIALDVVPDIITLVPEKREEITTEGGLDVKKNFDRLKNAIPRLKNKGIVVSLFVDPDEEALELTKKAGADSVELHTGSYANANGEKQDKEFQKLAKAARYAQDLGLFVAAGHGLNYENTGKILTIESIKELNIGHSVISRSIFTGLNQAVIDMLQLIKTK